MTDQMKQAEQDTRDPAMRIINELAAKRHRIAVFREAGVLFTIRADYEYLDHYIAQDPDAFVAVYAPGCPVEYIREDLA